jgi:hypothetical protein
MGDQLQPVQAIQKWYANPQVLIPAAAIGYLLLNKKTRKKTLIYGGRILLVGGGSAYIFSKEGYLRGLYLFPAVAGGIMIALGSFSKSK